MTLSFVRGVGRDAVVDIAVVVGAKAEIMGGATVVMSCHCAAAPLCRRAAAPLYRWAAAPLCRCATATIFDLDQLRLELNKLESKASVFLDRYRKRFG
jgi:hypothetical protein